MKTFSFAFAFFVFSSFSLTAFAEIEPCWRLEINPRTEEKYNSVSDWNRAMWDWERASPLKPSPAQLFAASKIYFAYNGQVTNWNFDKAAHCFLGCKMSQEISFQAAQYTAWFKEFGDLRDCNEHTHFGQADYNATIQGAALGQDKNMNCEQLCASKDTP